MNNINVITRELAKQGHNIIVCASLPRTIIVDGKSLPTTNSDGSYIHHTTEGIENFWRWFGESKAVDNEGHPEVWHHGSVYSFDEFTAGEFGFHFGNESAANIFGDVHKVYIKATKPFRIAKDLGEWSPLALLKILENREYKGPTNRIDEETINKVQNKTKYALTRKFKKELGQDDDMLAYSKAYYEASTHVRELYKQRGYDSIYYKNEGEGGWSYIVFDPNQVKSATGNSGEFSARSNSINK